MLKFRILLVLLITAIVLSCILIYTVKIQENDSYFGVTKNQPKNINVTFDVIINQIPVKEGDFVHKGDTLISFSQSELESRIRNLNFESDKTYLELQQKTAQIAEEKSLLNIKYQQEINFCTTKINYLNTEIAQQKELLKNLQFSESNKIILIKEEEIKNYKTQIFNITENYKAKITQENLKIQQLNHQLTYLKENQKSHQQYLVKNQPYKYLIAPLSGYIQKIAVTKGESVKAYNLILSMMQVKPDFIIAFIPENTRDNLKIGDQVHLTSVARPEIVSKGTITEKGNMMVELPLRLRKFSEIKTYGKELYIELPKNNQFLLNEKLMVTHIDN